MSAAEMQMFAADERVEAEEAQRLGKPNKALDHIKRAKAFTLGNVAIDALERIESDTFAYLHQQESDFPENKKNIGRMEAIELISMIWRLADYVIHSELESESD